MYQRTAVVRRAGSTAVSERSLPGIRAELDQQRRLRFDQFKELTADAAEAVTAADGPHFR